MKISVCLIVKNEENQLGRALSSIPQGFETIVVDTGSTDNTVAVAKQFVTKVFDYKWNNHFADARNESIKHATGDYILIMDADEELHKDAGEALLRHVRRYPNRPSSVLIYNLSDNETTAHHAVRLFPNDSRYHYKGSIHEHLYDREEIAVTVQSDVKLNHYGYMEEQVLSKDKFNRNLNLYNAALADDPQNGYLLYQLGKLYYSTKQYQLAYEPIAAAVDLQQFDYFYYPPLLVMFGYTLKELKYSRQAYEILEPLVDMYPAFPDLSFLLGMLAMEIGLLDEIERHFNRAMAIGDTTQYSTVVGSGSYRAAHNLGVYYEVTGNYDEAYQFYKRAAEYHFEPSVQRLKEVSNKS
jgi:Glycosyltransferases involved in cell wall biogenesis